MVEHHTYQSVTRSCWMASRRSSMRTHLIPWTIRSPHLADQSGGSPSFITGPRLGAATLDRCGTLFMVTFSHGSSTRHHVPTKQSRPTILFDSAQGNLFPATFEEAGAFSSSTLNLVCVYKDLFCSHDPFRSMAIFMRACQLFC